jgi:hypothetical protein
MNLIRVDRSLGKKVGLKMSDSLSLNFRSQYDQGRQDLQGGRDDDGRIVR